MKRIALLAVVGAGLMALPSTATAQRSPCPSPVYVNPGPPPYACVAVPLAPTTGGPAGGEVVVNPGGCNYVNAWETNPGTPGYAGICTGTPSRGPDCSTTGNGGANTGGCFLIKGAPLAVNQALNTFPIGLVTASFICGNTTGENPKNAPHDGCAIPELD